MLVLARDEGPFPPPLLSFSPVTEKSFLASARKIQHFVALVTIRPRAVNLHRAIST